MILWRNFEIFHFYHFDSDPRFPIFLLYVRWKSGVTFVWRCFRDVESSFRFETKAIVITQDTTSCYILNIISLLFIQGTIFKNTALPGVSKHNLDVFKSDILNVKGNWKKIRTKILPRNGK